MLEAMRQLSFSTAQFEILADAFESAVAFPPTSSGALPDHGQAMTLACALAELVEDRERFLSFGRDYFTRSRKKVS